MLLVVAGAVAGEAVNESARQIPVAYQVDVLVVGGSMGAVAAAVEAAGAGAKVFLACMCWGHVPMCPGRWPSI
jgi:heterodisulfide reductase subunit A-like polyferredoxin